MTVPDGLEVSSSSHSAGSGGGAWATSTTDTSSMFSQRSPAFVQMPANTSTSVRSPESNVTRYSIQAGMLKKMPSAIGAAVSSASRTP